MANSGFNMEDLPIGTLTKAGTVIEEKGDWVALAVVVDPSDGSGPLEGVSWKKADKRDDLVELQKSVGAKVRYSYKAGTEKSGPKLNAYPVKEDSGKQGGKQGGKGGFQRRGDDAKDTYWKEKAEDDRILNAWKIQREAHNDAKIEWQAYANILQPLVTTAYHHGVFGDPNTKEAVGAAATALLATASDWYKKRNPNGSLVPPEYPAKPVAPEPVQTQEPGAAAPKSGVKPPSEDDLPF